MTDRTHSDVKPVAQSNVQSDVHSKNKAKDPHNSGSPLQGATLDIQIQGIIALTELKQRFVNDSKEVIEAIYQFPLPRDAVVTAVKVTINGQHFTGQIQPRQQATETYEAGIAEGKRSVLLGSLGDGLYQIAAGNLDRGDVAEIQISIASLISYRGGRWRYYLPTVIAPKYGQTALEFDQQPTTSIFADHALKGQLSIRHEQLSDLACSINTASNNPGQWTLTGKLDRDLTLSWQSAQPMNRLYAACSSGCDNETSEQTVTGPETGSTWHGISLLTADLPEQDLTKLDQETAIISANVQLVVDCSGSMGGLSIAQARLGLIEALDGFGEQDRLNLIRFGSSHTRVFDSAQPVNGSTRRKLEKAINKLQADLGGTELYAALHTALECAGRSGGGDILLLTDGQIWENDDQFDGIIRTANVNQVRIFTIGVGSAVSENLLNKLSKQTGGNAIMLDQHNAMARQLTQLMQQLHAPRTRCEVNHLHGGWLQQPQAVFAGSSVPLYYAGEQQPNEIGVAFNSDENALSETEPTEETFAYLPMQQLEGEWGRALSRLAVQQQIREADEESAAQLAMAYQLISDYTSFVFVDEATVEAADGMPATQKVEQMVPHGRLDCLDVPAFLRKQTDHSACYSMELSEEVIPRAMMASRQVPSEIDQGADYLDIPEFLEIDTPPSPPPIAPYILESANRRLNRRIGKKQRVDINWLRELGLEEDICDQLATLSSQDELQIVCAFLLVLDEQHQLLTTRVRAYCKAKAGELVDDEKIRGELLLLSEKV